MRRTHLAALLTCLLLAGAGRAQPIEITVEGGKTDLKNVPICVPLSLAKEPAVGHVELKGKGRRGIHGQLTLPDIKTEHIRAAKEGMVRRDLYFVLPEIKAGEKVQLTGTESGVEWVGPGFRWDKNKDGTTTLVRLAGEKTEIPVLRYMNAAYDATSEASKNKTYKVFHHLYDPEGKRLVTNGGHTDPYTDEKKLLYPHHRGIMFAFNKITYGEDLKKTADTWHAKPGDTHEGHIKVLSEEAGPVLGRHRVAIDWFGAKNDVFAREDRELTVYNVPGGTLVEFATRLKTAGGKVKLDGDPQHAGFQFRAANEVAEKNAKQTYFLRPWGKGEMGTETNWPQDKRQVNLPWHVLSFVLGGKRYSVEYMDSPKNPGEKRTSERTYGRFGSYFEYDLTAENPLVLNYRLWLQDGEMTAEQATALREAFVNPPRVTVK